MVPWTGAFLILLVSVFRRDQRRRWLDLTTVIGYTVYVAIGTQLTILLARRMTRTYDAEFFRADALLGFNPVAFADAISRHWLVMVVLILAYVSLSAVIGLAWVLEQDLLMRRAVLLAGCLCFVFYGLFPAVGPGHFDWAREAPTSAPDNCMPSMHLTWSLLIAMNARSLRLRVGLWVYVALMSIATLALREHYLIDLIAAVPYTLAVQWIARRCERYLPVAKADSPRATADRLNGGESQS
jgi:hypothetical protein